jgi:hypothetical protein
MLMPSGDDDGLEVSVFLRLGGEREGMAAWGEREWVSVFRLPLSLFTQVVSAPPMLLLTPMEAGSRMVGEEAARCSILIG